MTGAEAGSPSLAQLAARVEPRLHGVPWVRHTIDGASRGADGVRLGDFNGDGRPDVVTGWEEGGEVRLCLHPGPGAVREPWPSVRIGSVASPEDAVPVDLDGDGRLDVLSACEGRTLTLFAHWAPGHSQDLLDPDAWRTEPIPASAGRAMWMYALPLAPPSGPGGGGPAEKRPRIAVGAKGEGGVIAILSPASDGAASLADWAIHPLGGAGWIMSIHPWDADSDGDVDLVVSDRKGPACGIYWLENPGPVPAAGTEPAWPRHAIGGAGEEAMFLDVADLDGDGSPEVAAAVKPRGVLVFRRAKDRESAIPGRDSWTAWRLDIPDGITGRAKAVRAGDIDGDGRSDLVFSCEGAVGELRGVVWLRAPDPDDPSARWQMHDVAGEPGTKFDHVVLEDLDSDGDLDIMTCEEAENLGVVWYENPGA